MRKERDTKLTRLVARLGMSDIDAASLDDKKEFLKGRISSKRTHLQARLLVVLRQYYDLDGEGERTLRQIADPLGIMPERVRQLLLKTEKRLPRDTSHELHMKQVKRHRLLHKLAEMYEKGESCVSDKGIELDGYDIGEAVADALEVLFGHLMQGAGGAKRDFLKGFIKHL